MRNSALSKKQKATKIGGIFRKKENTFVVRLNNLFNIASTNSTKLVKLKAN